MERAKGGKGRDESRTKALQIFGAEFNRKEVSETDKNLEKGYAGPAGGIWMEAEAMESIRQFLKD